ncbi:MAG: TlpA disulfide reductase family protein [Tenuifilaceae bacterium]|nr:TlpA disulfide reductase family protein [Tenuifilaceae bacterium]
MKRVIICIFTLAALASCNNFTKKEAVLSGSTANFVNQYGLLTTKGVTDTVWLNQDGSFSKTISILAPTYYSVRFDRTGYTLYLTPGSEINLSLDAKETSENPFSEGKVSAHNKLILKINQEFRNLTRDFRSLYSLPADQFTSKIDSAETAMSSLIDNFEVTDNVFTSLEKARVKYRFANIKYDYPQYNAIITQTQSEVDPSYYAYIDGINLSNQKHISISEYTDLISKHLNRLLQNKLAKDENKGKSEFEHSIIFGELVDSVITQQELSDYVKCSSTLETIKWSSFEVAKNVAEHFIANAKTEAYISKVENELAKRMLLAPGKPAPDFNLTGIDGKEYSLSDFKGKLLYIDFWATWCNPCRAEIPHLAKLKEAYANKNITIIGISLDDDKAAWEKMVTEEPLKGIQLHAEKAWQSDISKNYQIYGIPTFVLIDAEGNIIEYPASRPSQPETILLIDKHLKQL